MHIITDLREQKGLTKADLARALGVTRSAVTHWESGKNHPSKQRVIAMADFFHVSTDLLLGSTPPGPLVPETPICHLTLAVFLQDHPEYVHEVDWPPDAPPCLTRAAWWGLLDWFTVHGCCQHGARGCGLDILRELRPIAPAP